MIPQPAHRFLLARPTRLSGWEGLLFALVVGISFHALYGHLGFSPTDEGFLQAQSRRLLDGQLPHRDFISPRPVGSPLLHAHLLFWAGERLFWWGRLVAACEIAATAWLWTALLASAGLAPAVRVARLALAAAAVPVTLHIFPAIPWHTIDAVFFSTLGLWLARTSHSSWGVSMRRLVAGSLLAGAAVLFRQNFAPVALLAPAFSGRARDPRGWIAAAIPVCVYAGTLAAFGALPDALDQMGSNTGSLPGVLTIGLRLTPPWPVVGALFGLLAAVLLFLPGRLAPVAASLSLGVPIALAAWQSAAPSPWGIPIQGWVAWGGLLGFLPAILHPGTGLTAARPVAFFALIAGLAAAISIGHAAPSLAGGGAWLLLAAIAGRLLPPLPRRPLRVLAVVALVALAVRFHAGRTHFVYMDLPAADLVRPAGALLPGADGLVTNETTAAFLGSWRRHARVLDERAGPGKWASGPDLAATWALSPGSNPLPADWLYPVELAAPVARRRLDAAIRDAKGPEAFLLQRHEAAALPWMLRPADTVAVPALTELTQSWVLVGDGDPWFRVYARPRSAFARSFTRSDTET